MTPKVAENVIKSCSREAIDSYLGYWIGLIPKSHREYYDRWLFGFLSVHQHWQGNVAGFLEVKKLPNVPGQRQIKEALQRAKVGLYNTRAVNINTFARNFWDNPEVWYPMPGEMLFDTRARLIDRVKGMGRAKIAFVLEMLCPASNEIVCLDSHMLGLYGLHPDTVKDYQYLEAERHWLGLCKRYRKPSAMVRHHYWDRLRGRTDTRYWSFVFEDHPHDRSGMAGK